jgi:phosphoribosylglycinamide formyltransferase 1
MSSAKFRIAIFASGSGSNAEEIIKHFSQHQHIKVVLVLTNNPQAFVLDRAKQLNVPSKVFSREMFRQPGEVLQWLNESKVTHVVLAGFLWLLPEYLIKAYPDRIVNIHPALLPKFGGKGMYGPKVHESVKAAGDKETGITIHLVNEKYDEGKILFQGRCNVEDSYSPEKIAECVHKLEYEHYPKVIEQWIMNEH